MITNATGTTVYEADSYPFGGERVITNTLSDANKFAGMYRDSESGLDHTLFRKFSSGLCRWMGPDPIAGSALDPQSLNRYAYVVNNPTNLVDPLGLLAVSICPYSVECTYDHIYFDDPENKGGLLGAEHCDITFSNCWIRDNEVEGGGGGGGGGGDELTSNKRVLKEFYCLWAKAGFGFQRTERAMWVTKGEDGSFGFVQWPWTAKQGSEKFKGTAPEGRVAIAHTHPNVMSPLPSGGDHLAANTNKGKVPVYTIHRKGIWKAVPNVKKPVNVLGSKWWKPFSKANVQCD